MKTSDVQVGDQFTYTTPSGLEITYTVDALDVQTKHGGRLPRCRSATGRVVFIHDELLEQDWWVKRGTDDQP